MKMKEKLEMYKNGEITAEEFELAVNNRANEKRNERQELVMKMARSRSSLGD